MRGGVTPLPPLVTHMIGDASVSPNHITIVDVILNTRWFMENFNTLPALGNFSNIFSNYSQQSKLDFVQSFVRFPQMTQIYQSILQGQHFSNSPTFWVMHFSLTPSSQGRMQGGGGDRGTVPPPPKNHAEPH